MKKILHIFVFAITFFHAQCQNFSREVFDRQVIEDNLVLPGDFMPLPQAKDSFWRQSLPQEFCSDYIRLGHGYDGAKWEKISDTVFGEYRATGNRANYERLSFALRRQMASLVMAEIMEHKGLLLDDILKGLDYFIQEIWWGVSAHYPYAKPDPDVQVVDLFNSETANLLAWTIYMLHDELENKRPGICNVIKKEINRRLLIPARRDKSSWKNNVGNHNTWTCSNWLACVLLCESDRKQQLKDIEQIITSLETFINGYPDDGGCDEGVGYWDRAAASLFESIRMLTLATNGKLSLCNNTKLKAMASYVYKTYINRQSFVNFADTHANSRVAINILYPFGRYIGDYTMMKYAAFIGKENNFQHNPSKLFLQSGNFVSLPRELFFLLDYNSFANCEPSEPLVRDNWLPDIQVMTGRSYENSTEGFFVAAKGGHNAENHNHNDVGSFIVYSDSNPLFIDLGFATYTSKTFSAGRYELMNCRSGYHNAPLINGYEQHEGQNYRATNVEYKNNNKHIVFSLNLEGAYPREAGANKWRRSISFNRKSIEIIEDYELSKFEKPSEVVLICCGNPSVEKRGLIKILTDEDSHYVSYNSKQLSPVIEFLQINDIEDWRNKPIYRIRLVVRNQRLKDRIKYKIL